MLLVHPPLTCAHRVTPWHGCTSAHLSALQWTDTGLCPLPANDEMPYVPHMDSDSRVGWATSQCPLATGGWWSWTLGGGGWHHGE